MKRRRVERVERRRPLIEVNLISEDRTRPSIARRGRGCRSFLTLSLLALAALLAHILGLL